jgi:hypothetical protein
VNWQKGLQRISAVWWSAWGLLLAVFCIAALSSGFGGGSSSDLAGGLIGLVVGLPIVYGLHKLTCWVIAGFIS